MTRTIAITGTDGTGKTTLIRRLGETYAGRPDQLRAFRAPQYHEDPDHPFGLLSEAIDALSVLGDQRGNPLLKATALFLSMTLYGDVAAHLARTYRPGLLLAERQCLADSLTYARFYLPLLQAPLDEASIGADVAKTLAGVHPRAAERLDGWLRVLQGRDARAASTLWQLPLYIRDLFSQPPAELVASLRTLYHAEVPDRIILLTVRPEVLVARLAAKRGHDGEVPRELHEQTKVLAMFQAGLADSCEFLRTVRPDLAIDVLDTSDQDLDQTEAAVLAILGAKSS